MNSRIWTAVSPDFKTHQHTSVSFYCLGFSQMPRTSQVILNQKAQPRRTAKFANSTVFATKFAIFPPSPPLTGPHSPGRGVVRRRRATGRRSGGWPSGGRGPTPSVARERPACGTWIRAPALPLQKKEGARATHQAFNSRDKVTLNMQGSWKQESKKSKQECSKHAERGTGTKFAINQTQITHQGSIA